MVNAPNLLISDTALMCFKLRGHDCWVSVMVQYALEAMACPSRSDHVIYVQWKKDGVVNIFLIVLCRYRESRVVVTFNALCAVWPRATTDQLLILKNLKVS